MYLIIQYKEMPVEIELDLDIGVDQAEPDVGIPYDRWYVNGWSISDIYINGKSSKNISKESMKKLEAWVDEVDLDDYDTEVWDYLEGLKDNYDERCDEDKWDGWYDYENINE